MEWRNERLFNPEEVSVMHVDLNSCFASVEQQANPLLRGKPVAVAAYATPSGCVLAASVEAKVRGVKTGMRVREARVLIPELVVLEPDSDKYREVHGRLKRVLECYTDVLVAKSIDEYVLDLKRTPALKRGLVEVGGEIKRRIRQEVGEWMRVSIGLSTNRNLAKVASNLRKPDGLEVIDKNNFWEVYGRLKLEDLHGINERLAVRLNMAGMRNVREMYEADVWKLKEAFGSALAYYWYSRLRGWEVDEVEWGRKSFGNMYSLPKATKEVEELSPILMKLVSKAAARMRRDGYTARGVWVGMRFAGGGYWHKRKTGEKELVDSRVIYRLALRLMREGLSDRVGNLSVTCFGLSRRKEVQMSLFGEVERERRVMEAMDELNEKWGYWSLMPATMGRTENVVRDRIGFGNVKGLEGW